MVLAGLPVLEILPLNENSEDVRTTVSADLIPTTNPPLGIIAPVQTSGLPVVLRRFLRQTRNQALMMSRRILRQDRERRFVPIGGRLKVPLTAFVMSLLIIQPPTATSLLQPTSIRIVRRMNILRDTNILRPRLDRTLGYSRKRNRARVMLTQ